MFHSNTDIPLVWSFQFFFFFSSPEDKQKKYNKNKIKPLHTFELSLISNHTTMNCSILGSDDHRGSSSFHPSIEELFCFVQFYWIHCDRSSFSIYFLIKNNHFLGTSTGLRSSIERHIISRG